MEGMKLQVKGCLCLLAVTRSLENGMEQIVFMKEINLLIPLLLGYWPLRLCEDILISISHSVSFNLL